MITYKCPKCEKKYLCNLAETEGHKYSSTPEKVERNQIVGYKETTSDGNGCGSKIFEIHSHYEIIRGDIYTYKCKCGHVKEDSKNYWWDGYQHTKPTVRKLKK